ncbi:BON domain-containing protein [uncultured Nevskia sp.]|uniref:BON domain-containing protein n=1 Tax=uncultured Nevskia sp. TaxID=228950 RepID=UPI0025F4801D|nr:BON domain-containing protein [uncultured Nevskia sp.]
MNMKTDSQLEQDVIAELKWEPAVNAANIGVEVKNGVLTLTGSVDSYSEKWTAEHSALRVAGVTALTVALEVKLPGMSKRADIDIARLVENVITWTTLVPRGCVKVMVENGWVTLSGQVEWSFQRESALAAVRHLTGVVGVSNDIAIEPKVSKASVKTEIEAALTRSVCANANRISVEVHGSEVTLFGKVDTWSERSIAEQSAWGTPGVRKVIDNITVVY